MNKVLGTIVVILLMVMASVGTWFIIKQPKESVVASQYATIVDRIKLHRTLETADFVMQTIVKTEQDGTWQQLWQDKQQGLFIVKGSVKAGVDLSQLVISPFIEGKEPTITLPSATITSISLDSVEVYNWETGLFGLADNNPQLLTVAQQKAKADMLNTACQQNILGQANDQAMKTVKDIFVLAGIDVVVNDTPSNTCLIKNQ